MPSAVLGMTGTSQGLETVGRVQSHTAAAGLSQHENPGVWVSQFAGSGVQSTTHGGLTQKCVVSQLWRLEVRKHGVDGAVREGPVRGL